MAKAKGQGAKKGEDRRKGRAPLSESGATKPTTFRISPGGIEAILTLNERLGLGSQAGAIETACAQLLDALERCDTSPPLTADQLALAVEAVKAARVNPRVLGPTARFGIVLVAAVMAYEPTAVPSAVNVLLPWCCAESSTEPVRIVRLPDSISASVTLSITAIDREPPTPVPSLAALPDVAVVVFS